MVPPLISTNIFRKYTMQVAQVNDHVTHAVIGGQKAMNFSVSDDAELMNVLSKALYTDQQLAVVRETMCNAWDAHIDAGVTKRAIEITINQKELIVRDYGFGIPKAMIQPVYGTYGGSTKKSDGRVTGGFGLGCKSPFAYTDNFEVTSWSSADKEMTVYNMSKSNAEIGGRPGIIPIVSAPTTEQGLQVRIKLNAAVDYVRFGKLVKRIASNGNMNAIVNGEIVECLPFHEMSDNFLITDEPISDTDHLIMLRYGHVIYPIEAHDSYAKALRDLVEMLGNMPNKGVSWNNRKTYKIIFQAEPDSISITPSREALSMQEGTVAEIYNMITDFVANARPMLSAGAEKLLNESIENVWINSKPAVLFGDMDRMPNMPVWRFTKPYITSYKDFVEVYVSANHQKINGFADKDHSKRIAALVDAQFGDVDLVKSYQKAFNIRHRGAPSTAEEVQAAEKWLHLELYGPLMKDLATDPAMNSENLKVWMPENQRNNRTMKLYGTNQVPFRTPKFTFGFIRKILVLAHSRIDWVERVDEFPAMKNWYGPSSEVFLYTVARSPRKVEYAKEFFKSRGYVIMDLTVAQPWEETEAAAPRVSTFIGGPRRTGIPALTSCIDPESSKLDMRLPPKELENLLRNPKFIVKFNPKNADGTFGDLSGLSSRFVVEEWGELGAFVVNQNQETKYTESGAISWRQFVLERVLEEFQTNPRIIQSLPYMWNRSKQIMQKTYSSYNFSDVFNYFHAVYADKDLMEYFDIIDTMTKHDKKFVKLWDEMYADRTGSELEAFKQLRDLDDEVYTSSAVMDLFTKIRHMPMKNMLNDSYVKEMMQGTQKITPGQRIFLRDTLLQAIEG